MHIILYPPASTQRDPQEVKGKRQGADVSSYGEPRYGWLLDK
jgi:hypothetical protein